LEDPESSQEKHTFKARQIPKTHKAPFVVYHSTKSLTSFNNPAHLKPKPVQIINTTKIMARTPYEELGNKSTEVEASKNDIQICSENTDLSALINWNNEANKCIDEHMEDGNELDENDAKQIDVKEETHVKKDEDDLRIDIIENVLSNDTERFDQKLMEIDSECSRLDLSASGNDWVSKFLKDSGSKASSVMNNSTDSKDSKETISLDGREADESPLINLTNVFGGGIDIDTLIQNQW
jgi:hypothetical protein